ncbi:17560_t:CDS:1 [Gigaspora rosea]|nr:17560_t:CDS:1 [Gigaspora rosea]
MYQKDKTNENRSLQELPESINTINEDHITSEEENYTNSDEISNDDCYTDNAIPDKKVTSSKVLQDIQNPAHVIKRGKPSKRCYMSSTKKKRSRGGTSSRGTYKCGRCGEVGHNAAFHKRKRK